MRVKNVPRVGAGGGAGAGHQQLCWIQAPFPVPLQPQQCANSGVDPFPCPFIVQQQSQIVLEN